LFAFDLIDLDLFSLLLLLFVDNAEGVFVLEKEVDLVLHWPDDWSLRHEIAQQKIISCKENHKKYDILYISFIYYK
jgi:hypothetical protein